MNVSIKFNERKKPMQPANITIDGLYGYVDLYTGPIFDYSVRLLGKKFKEKTNIDTKVSIGPVKTKQRVLQKLEEDDIASNPSNILDILRATVVVKTVEDLLEFLQFSKNLVLKDTDFKDLDKDILNDMYNDYKQKVLKNLASNDGSDVISDKELFERMKNKDLIKEAENQSLLRIKKFKNNITHNMEDTPITNVHISNSFSLKLTDNIKNKYEFLKENPRVKNSNYMDFKFYICIPIPSFGLKGKKDYMICEIIATLECFDKVYDKTHCLFEAKRSFKSKPSDDIAESTYKLAIDALIRGKYVDDVIGKYNEQHSNGIQILPHNDNKLLRDDVLNSVGSSVTLTTSICCARKNMR